MAMVEVVLVVGKDSAEEMVAVDYSLQMLEVVVVDYL
mgnify:CR=1 FL=1